MRTNVSLPRMGDTWNRHMAIQKKAENKINGQSKTLRQSVHSSLSDFFVHLDGQPITNLYEMVLTEIEAPLLDVVMKHAKDNQTKASEILGLNRGTLRKKLKQYDLL
ncbi:MAG: DNA-binding transcriptional regulator Fis [Pseudomonadales bacterium]|nr:DNA-binding transcriptional regulator Fis [Pseudomonadales bacterium]